FASHLDYHKSLDNYKQAKFNIFKNQTAEDFIIYNADNQDILEEVKHTKAMLIPFSAEKELQAGAWADDEFIYFQKERIIEKRKIVLLGKHNLENILAAVAAAKL